MPKRGRVPAAPRLGSAQGDYGANPDRARVALELPAPARVSRFHLGPQGLTGQALVEPDRQPRRHGLALLGQPGALAHDVDRTRVGDPRAARLDDDAADDPLGE
jgi:hypothetical protein